jgi:hypothetical protein
MRILLDPTSAQGGGTPTPEATPPSPATPPAPPPSPAAPVPPQTISLPYEEYQRLSKIQEELGKFQATAAQAERDKIQALADQKAGEGQWKSAADLMRTTHAAELAAQAAATAEAERRARTFAKQSALMAELAGRPLLPGVAKQLASLIHAPLDAYPDGESFTVRTSTFQDVKTYLDTELARPEYAHFLAAGSRGGAGGGGGTQGPTVPATPVTMGDEMIARKLAQAAAQGPIGARPIGLARTMIKN